MYAIKDQSNPDLEKWLKNNKPTVLKHGESLGQPKFIDNSKVKRDLEQEKKAQAETIKRNKAIASQNKKREKLAKEKMQKIEKEYKTKQAIALQAEVLKPFYERAKRADITNLANLTGLSSYELRSALTTKALLNEQLESIKNTLADFKWFVPMTKIELLQRRKKPAPKKLTPEEEDRKRRWHIANKARKEAVANGLTEFVAVCAYHGETAYTVGSRGSARCVECAREKSKKYNSKIQTPEQKAKFERQSRNRAEMVKAVELGLTEFEGNCGTHGLGKFVIIKKKGEYKNSYPFQYKCCQCEYQHAIKRKERRKELALLKSSGTIVT